MTDPDNESVAVTVTIVNGGDRGDFTAGSATDWTRSTSGSDIVYSRTFPARRTGGGDHGGADAGLRPTRKRHRPGTTETTTFTVSVDDSGSAVSNDDTISAVTTSINDSPTIAGEAANQAVNDNATLSAFSTLTVTDPDNESVAVTVTIVNGANRGDFTPEQEAGPAAPAAATLSTAAPSGPGERRRGGDHGGAGAGLRPTRERHRPRHDRNDHVHRERG